MTIASPRRRPALAVTLALLAGLLAFASPVSASADTATSGTVSGTVSFEGVGVAGVQVFFFSLTGDLTPDTVTDANGNFSASGLAFGDYYLNVYPDSSIYRFVDGVPFTLSATAPAATADAALQLWATGTASVTGIVTDGATGGAIPGAQITLVGERGYSSVADETGTYFFGDLPAGEYSLFAYVAGYLNPGATVTVADAQAATANIALVAANSTVSGHVQSASGDPVVGLYVNASATGGFLGGGDQTDENGDYVITNLGAGTYTLSMAGVGSPFVYQAREVTAVANSDVVADFTLTPRTTGYLTGMVFGPNGDYYSQPVCATLYSSKNKKPLAQVATYGENYGDGTYSFDNLAPGTYTVEFRDCDDDPGTKFEKVFLGGVKNFKDATIVTVVAGQDSYENNVTMVPKH